MRRRTLALVVTSLGAFVLVACASLGGLSGGTEDGPDAAKEGATTVEAASEPIREASAPLDAADAGAYCDGIDATLCEDFDDTNAPGVFPGWAQAVAAGSSLTRVDAGYSAPNALQVDIEANAQSDAGTTLVANLAAALPTASRVRLVYRFIVDTPDPGGSTLHLCTLTATNAGTQMNVRFALASGKGKFVTAVYPTDGGAAAFNNPGEQPLVSAGVWHDVEISLDLVGQFACATVKFDGAVVTDDAAIVSLGPSPLKVQIGAFYASAPTSGWSVRIDDYAVFAE